MDDGEANFLTFLSLSFWGIIALAIISGVLGLHLDIKYIFLTPPVIVITLIVLCKIRDSIDENNKKSRKLREEEKANLNRIINEQSNLKHMINSCENKIEELHRLIEDAEYHLDKADAEFSEGVFAPFWDEIEHATNSLAAYHQNINELARTGQDYARRANQLAVKVPAFSLPLHKLPDARPTAQRLAKIVRKAQKDPDFAKIYELRRTNQLLYQGFRSLGDALYSMGDQISYSLDGLSDRLNVSLNDLLDSSREQSRILTEQDVKLDNIQRRRKPPY